MKNILAVIYSYDISVLAMRDSGVSVSVEKFLMLRKQLPVFHEHVSLLLPERISDWLQKKNRR